MFGLSAIEKNSKKYHTMYEQVSQLNQRLDDILEKGVVTDDIKQLEAEKKRLMDEINEFIENEYSLSIYKKYNPKKPRLIRLKTNEEVCWEDAFGDNYHDISKSLKHSLVGLIEGDGRYKLK